MSETRFMTAREVEQEYGIDLVTAETIRAGLIEVTRHMHKTLQRSAFSNSVRELLDFGVCIHMIEPEGIEMAAVTEGCTHFAFTHPHMCNFVFDEWGLDNLGPGDTLICNDPWRGSIHIPDVNLFRPVFWEGEPVFALSDASHLLDMGGPVPGSFNSEARESYAEGLRLPPLLITSGDVPVRSTISLILENSRTQLHNLGDLRALFGTMKVGEGRLHLLLERYGLEAVRAAARYGLDLAERRMRAAIEAVPDGVYEAEEWVDEDGMTPDPVRLFMSGRVAGSSIELDFSGTDRQPLGSLTTCWEEMNRVLVGPKMMLDGGHPMNAGAMRPFHVTAPVGSVVMGAPPTSNSQHTELGTKIASLSLKLFSQMVPERAIATDSGTTNAYVASGVDDRPGREGQAFGMVLCEGIAWGGTAVQDGISFCSSPIYGIGSAVIELIERDGPVAIRSLDLIKDSAGAGQFRSGFGNALMFECLADEMSFSFILDSGRFPRAGAVGGGAGMTSYIFKVEKEPDNSIPRVDGIVPLDRLIPVAGRFTEDGVPDPVAGEWATGTELGTLKKTGYALQRGDVLLIVPAGGGGYGDPLQRPPSQVASDVWNERISREAAERCYGVVLGDDPLEVDEEATASARKRFAEQRERGKWEVPVASVSPWPASANGSGGDRVAAAASGGGGR